MIKKIIILIIPSILCIISMLGCYTEAKRVSVDIDEHSYKTTIDVPKPDVDRLLMEIQKNTTIEDIKRSISSSVNELQEGFGLNDGDMAIIIMISVQYMFLVKDGSIVDVYPVSTSKYGIGSKSGSNKTPLGVHEIQAKIGDGAPIGAIFKGKVFTGEIAEISYAEEDLTDDDYVTTRVLPLRGLEDGLNRGKGVDSFSRAIYIHGTPEEGLIGKEASHGCIRMLNEDVITLFNSIEIGTLVNIIE